MLQVGIHENVRLSDGAGFNDKGTFKIVLTQSQKVTESIYAAMTTGKDLATEDANIFIFAPNVLEYGKTTPKQDLAIAKEIQIISRQLKAFLKIYMKEADVEKAIGGEKLFAGLGANEENLPVKLQDQTFVNAVIHQLCKNFLGTCTTKKLFHKDPGFRIKLIRQSKKSHFPRLSPSFDTWIERMDVDKESSKIAFTDYEKGAGLDSSAPTAVDKTSKKDADTADGLFEPDKTVDDVFKDTKVEETPPAID